MSLGHQPLLSSQVHSQRESPAVAAGQTSPVERVSATIPEATTSVWLHLIGPGCVICLSLDQSQSLGKESPGGPSPPDTEGWSSLLCEK